MPVVSREQEEMEEMEEMEAASVTNGLGYRSGHIRGSKPGVAAPVSVKRLGCVPAVTNPSSQAFPNLS